jgi:hypothetical protein
LWEARLLGVGPQPLLITVLPALLASSASSRFTEVEAATGGGGLATDGFTCWNADLALPWCSDVVGDSDLLGEGDDGCFSISSCRLAGTVGAALGGGSGDSDVLVAAWEGGELDAKGLPPGAGCTRAEASADADEYCSSAPGGMYGGGNAPV